MLNIKISEIESVANNMSSLILAYKEALEIFSFQIQKIENSFNEADDNISLKISKLMNLQNRLNDNVLKMENLKLSTVDGVNYDENIAKCKELIINANGNIDQISRMKHYIGEVKIEFASVLQLLNGRTAEIGLLFEATLGKIRKILENNFEDINIDKEATFRLIDKLNDCIKTIEGINSKIETNIAPSILQDKKINYFVGKFKEELILFYKELNQISDEIKKLSFLEDERLELISKII